MSELISRQAAIDAMCELMRHWFGCDSKDEIREIKRELGKLPSAQPEIIRCKDCKHYYALNEVRGNCSEYNFVEKIPIDFCSWAERKEE